MVSLNKLMLIGNGGNGLLDLMAKVPEKAWFFVANSMLFLVLTDIS